MVPGSKSTKTGVTAGKTCQNPTYFPSALGLALTKRMPAYLRVQVSTRDCAMEMNNSQSESATGTDSVHQRELKAKNQLVWSPTLAP